MTRLLFEKQTSVITFNDHGIGESGNQLLCQSYLIGHQRPSDSTWGNNLDYLGFISMTSR